MIEPMLGAAALHMQRHGGTAVVAGVKGAFDYESACASFKSTGVSVAHGNSREVIHDSDLVITASGTATLETGIIGRPMVIVYKTGEITYQIARRLIRLDKIGLVNLVLGEKVVPELIQHQATPAAIARELDRYASEREYCESVTRKLMRVPSTLGGVGASERAAAAIGRYL